MKNSLFVLLALLVFTSVSPAQTQNRDDQIQQEMKAEVQTVQGLVINNLRNFDKTVPKIGAVHKWLYRNGISYKYVDFGAHYKVLNSKYVGEVLVLHDLLNGNPQTYLEYSTSEEKLSSENFILDKPANLANIRIEECKPGECSLTGSDMDALRNQGKTDEAVRLLYINQHRPTGLFTESLDGNFQSKTKDREISTEAVDMVDHLRGDWDLDLGHAFPCLRDQDVLVFRQYFSTKKQGNAPQVNLDPTLQVFFDFTHMYSYDSSNSAGHFKLGTGVIQRLDGPDYLQAQIIGSVPVGELRGILKSTEAKLKTAGKPYHFELNVFGGDLEISDLENATSSFCGENGVLNKSHGDVQVSDWSIDDSLSKTFVSVKRP